MSLLTNTVPLSSSDWTDLGPGPMTVAAHGPEWANVVLALADAKPPLGVMEGEPLRNARFFGGTTHVWALSSGDFARVVVTAPDSGGSFNAPVTTAVVITPGTPVTPGRKALINCAAAGTVRLKLSGGSIIDLATQVGESELDGYAVVDVVAANTTASVTVTVLS